ncbi:MAG TPA: HIT domain-containing protein [Acidimicrobiales bacterium]
MPLDRFNAAWRESYVSSTTARHNLDDAMACVFCALASEPVNESTGVLYQSAESFITLNAYPYGSGHLLILPRRHVGELDELSDDEYLDFTKVLRVATRALTRAYGADGMNVGMNLGRAGGAGIPKHLHAHALPRWDGDTNFMTTIAETRVLPESLASTWGKVHEAIEAR